MGKTFLIIMIALIGILFILSIALTVTIILFVKSRNKWKQTSENQYIKGKEDGKTEAISVINSTINKIEDDKDKLNQMSEKQLMVSTMMALAGYGRRLDETNARLDTIVDYKSYILEMNKQMQVLSETYDNLQNTVKTAESSLNDTISSSQTKLKEAVESSKQSIESFDKITDSATESVNVLNSRLSNVGIVSQRIDEINVDLSQSLDLLRSLQMKSSSIMSEMDGLLKSYGESPIAKLDQIKSNMSDMLDRVEKINKKFKNVDESDLERLSDIRSKIEELYDKFEYVDANDLDKIDDIDSKLLTIESKLSDIESNMSGIESNVSDLESKISDISYRID